MIRGFGQEKGFTLLEVLLILAILILIGSLSIPIYQSFQVTSEFENTTEEITQTIRQAQISAMSSEMLVDQGVHFSGQQFILFRGSTYNPADVNNESFNIANTLSVSTGGNNDIIFSAVSGLPNAEATIVISSNNGRSNSIIINGLGVINVN